MDRFGFIHEKLDIKILILFILRRLALLSHFGMDNRTHEGVTERTDSRFPLRHYSQPKKSIKGKRCGL